MKLSQNERALFLGALLREPRSEAATLEIKAPGYGLGELRRAVAEFSALVERVKYITDNYESL